MISSLKYHPMRRVLLLIPLLCIGCGAVKNLKNLKIYAYAEEPIINQQQATLPINLKINNPYAVALRVVSVSLDVYIGGKRIGTATLSSPQAINAKGTTSIKLNLKTTKANLSNLQNLQISKNTPLRVKGYMTVEPLKGFGWFSRFLRYKIHIDRSVGL